MKYAPALLRAIVTLDGEALVLHAGDRPYVVSPRGPVELSSKPLAAPGLAALLAELLPPALLEALYVSGSVRWELPASADLPAGQFIVVAARVEEDPWVEVRR